MVIDTHMHINSMVAREFGLDVSKCIDDVNNNNGIFRVINVGLDVDTSKESIKISRNNPKFYSSVGIHPLYIKNQSVGALYRMISDKVVAIGEIGLDPLHDDYYEQVAYLVEQIMLANSLRLPVIIHSSNSNKKIIEIFEKYVKPQYGCVFHCFQPDLEDLEYLVSNGYYISFAGRVTYKNAKKSHEVLLNVPDDLYLIETDSPYISPEPFRHRVNKPEYIDYIIDKMAEVKNCDREIIINNTYSNAKRLFKIR